LSISTDEHERSNSAGLLGSSVGAGRLKIKAFDNATYHGGLSSESDETDDGEFETSDTKYQSIVNLNELNRQLFVEVKEKTLKKLPGLD